MFPIIARTKNMRPIMTPAIKIGFVDADWFAFEIKSVTKSISPFLVTHI
jgi:hypothetical protein